MTIVDSSAWIDYFNGNDTPAARRLQWAVDEDEWLGVVELIITEVLQGFRSESDFRRARQILVSLPRLTLGGETHIRAAQLYRRLRAAGMTIRSAIDCLIAQACIDADARILTGDEDFTRIARYSVMVLA